MKVRKDRVDVDDERERNATFRHLSAALHRYDAIPDFKVDIGERGATWPSRESRLVSDQRRVNCVTLQPRNLAFLAKV